MSKEVESFWLKHNKEPRVQIKGLDGPWKTLDHEPSWYATIQYRIHPKDLEKFMNTEEQIDITKPVMFRNSPKEKVEIRGTLNKVGQKYILIVVTDEEGLQCHGQRPADGRLYPHCYHPKDVINVPERVEKFANFYNNHVCRSDRLEFPGGEGFQGTVKLTYEEGKLISAEVVK